MEDSKIVEIFHSALELEAITIQNLKKNIDPNTIINLVHTISNRSGRLFTTGAGTSAAAARKIAHTFCCVGIPCCFLVPSDSVHGGLGALQENDLVIAISKGGNTKDIVQMIPGIKGKKAKLIAVTENEESVLAKNSDFFLKVKIVKEIDPFNMLATSSTIAVIAIFDAIACILITYLNYKKEDFAIIHPSGAVGERLMKEIEK